MSDDFQVQSLVDQLLNSNATPEEVCAGNPELLAAVRERCQVLRSAESDVKQMTALASAKIAGGSAVSPGSSALPAIPGYELISELGRGGMGVVYQARQLRLNRQVALKMVLPGAAASGHAVARFQREVEAVALLQHPNIVQIYEVGDWQGQPYFTMEFVEAGSLAKAWSTVSRSPLHSATLVAALAAAVEAAHRSGIIHRDLNPANILLTADGTPKIADFGIAWLEDHSSLTLSGAALGTPGYMAPEQLSANSAKVSPAVDIHGLGAILYELLTGRRPYVGETAFQLTLEVHARELVPPSRWNPRIPRDIETICLKCLDKAPGRRYSTAAELAEDLHRFQRGEPIAARRLSIWERGVRWVRRKPSAAALIGTSMLLAIVLASAAMWLMFQQSRRREAVAADMVQLRTLQQQSKWKDAGAVLARAGARLEGSVATDLRELLTAAEGDLKLAIELDRIRLNRETSGDLQYYSSRADDQYLTALQNAAVLQNRDPELEPPGAVARRIRSSAVRAALTAALDDWAVWASDKRRRDWILKISREADPSPEVGDQIRDPARWDDRAALGEIAGTVPVDGQSVSLMLSLGARLRTLGGDAVPFLKRVQREHPADFWTNMALGDVLLNAQPAEAASYYRAALASRPDAAVAHIALADSLRAQWMGDEAISYYRRALAIDREYARAQTSLAGLLRDRGELEEAIECYRRSLAIDPNYAWTHLDLANSLRATGQEDEALEHYRQFDRANPTLAHVKNILRSDRIRRGKGEEVREEWERALGLDPPDHTSWFGYAELCLLQGRDEDYRRARKDLIRKFGDATEPYVSEPTARAILLAPTNEMELSAAFDLIDRAEAGQGGVPDWESQYVTFARGLGEYRAGHFERAIDIMDSVAGKVMGPSPQFVTSMAHYRAGDERRARKELAESVVWFDWGIPQISSHDQWIWHILRREAESLMLPNLQTLLQNRTLPEDDDERLACLGTLEYHNRLIECAEIFRRALAADSRMEAGFKAALRHRAARAAARAGGDPNADGPTVSASEREEWRNQARHWLKEELYGWQQGFDTLSTGARRGVQGTLEFWQRDPDLSCLRDPQAQDTMSAEERNECRELWKSVDALRERCRLK